MTASEKFCCLQHSQQVEGSEIGIPAILFELNCFIPDFAKIQFTVVSVPTWKAVVFQNQAGGRTQPPPEQGAYL